MHLFQRWNAWIIKNRMDKPAVLMTYGMLVSHGFVQMILGIILGYLIWGVK